ncbi:MAG: capsule biosynthesis protein CapA, partial [Rhodobacteraceae bacterium]|nr:capsule biosynthesis protein CapA [Paracoccaceae bacterium]
MTASTNRHFLFLQGPHGPFFHQLGQMLRAAGAQVWRVGFNAGDRAFWFGGPGYIPFRGTFEDWQDTFRALVAEHGITDIALYGDTRPIHAQAISIARELGLTIHVYEEGYIRPYWVTYERGGTNGNSRLMDMQVADMRKALEMSDLDLPEPPAHWGDMRHHVFYGALYHWFVMFRNGGFPYHLVLLQLEHDSSFQMHSPFSNMTEFLELVIEGFAKGAQKHHHLVFKAHPLENDKSPIKRIIRDWCAPIGWSGLIVSASWASGPLERCFPAQAVDS